MKHLPGLLVAAMAVGIAVTAAAPGASLVRARRMVLDRRDKSRPTPIASSVLGFSRVDTSTARGGIMRAASC